MPESIVLLHGFGGTHHAWDGVVAHLDAQRYRPLALDLPGHGSAAAAPGEITFAGCVAGVLERSPERFILCGYSLGGRIALQIALAAPGRVKRLVLVSSTAGIEDAGEREQRRRAASVSPGSSKRSLRALHRALALPAAVRRGARARGRARP